MRIATFTLGVALASAGAWFASTAFTQDKDPGMEGMKRWMAACKPGPHHKELARFIGSWDSEMTITGMGGAPTKSKGTAECRWLVEGRWLEREWKGSMMTTPVTSHSWIGYDNFKQKFVASNVDTFTTTLLTSEGNFDQTGNALITYGLMDEPMTGENDKPVKYVWRFDGPDRIVYEVHDLAIGETNTKVIEVVFTRRK